MPPLGPPGPVSEADWLFRGAKSTERPETITLALHAWERGQSALARHDLPTARFWLERANRLGPEDTQVLFLLGLTELRQNDPRALPLFWDLVARSDTRPAHRGLVAALAMTGRVQEERTAAAALLARFSPPDDPEFPLLAHGIAMRHALPGWCAVDAEGRVMVQGTERPIFQLDGDVTRLRRDADGLYRLPPAWHSARLLSVRAEDQELLGSPLDLARRRLVEGFVESVQGGLQGWAWSPASPDRPVQLTLESPGGKRLPVVITTEQPAQFDDKDGLTTPLAFSVPADILRLYPGPLHIRDPFGQDLAGSPLDPGQWAAAASLAARLTAGEPLRASAGRPPLLPVWADTPRPSRPLARARARRPGVTVIIPVYRGLEITRRCLELVLADLPRDAKVLVVDDQTPEPALAAELDALARQRRIRLLRNPRNLGFPASVNLGLAAAEGRDVVLLNSDALVPPGWLDRLRAAAYAAPDIGTAAPLSNEATILSYPRVDGVQPPPPARAMNRIDALALRANGTEVVDIPTSVGFCMYIRHDCLAETGMFREDVFAQGYGEENDFCLRARHLGWRHVAATGLFVSHLGGQSFRSSRVHLQRRNQQILERLHPGYANLIAAHIAKDPLLPARRRLDLARWKALGETKGLRPAVLLITHNEGGGVERQVKARARSLAAEGFVPLILRPAGEARCRVERALRNGRPWDDDFPNLVFDLPGEAAALLRFLRSQKPQHAELHHRLGHAEATIGLAQRLGIPLDIHVHDYAAICPRVTLVTTTARYCGEPDAAVCEACVADLGSRLGEDIPVTALRQRTAREFAAAREVIFSSLEVEARFRRYLPPFPATVTPWERSPPSLPPSPAAQPKRGGRWRIGVIGAIGTEKGYDVLLACARDAAERGLPIEFVVIGYTHGDLRLIETGHVEITYRFAPERATEEITAQMADIGFIPSIWPETWCFALSDAWKAGLRTAVFDIGTQAQRVRETGNGWVLPLALPPASVNNALISLAQSTT